MNEEDVSKLEVTLDTNILQEYCRDQPKKAVVERLLALAEENIASPVSDEVRNAYRPSPPVSSTDLKTPTFAELLIGCDEDRTLREVLAGLLREADRPAPRARNRLSVRTSRDDASRTRYASAQDPRWRRSAAAQDQQPHTDSSCKST
jgi:hypothetical protein